MNHIVRRSTTEIHGHPSRVINRPFEPGQEGYISGDSRSRSVIDRVLALSDEEVEQTLAETMQSYSTRHDDLRASFRRNYAIVARPEETGLPDLPLHRMELIGAYFTQEYAIEAAALFNPSIVEAPDQSGCPGGSVRFIMSLRAVGEGHISSIEFRSGIVHPNDEITLEPVSPHLAIGDRFNIPAEWDYHLLPRDIPIGETTLPEVVPIIPPPTSTAVADTGYEVVFPETSTLSERVLFPGNVVESHGLEDTRLVRFVNDDGSISFFGTYTAYDGAHVTPHLLHTSDFLTFAMRPMMGEAAANKGMALFPRHIRGQLWCLSRWDRESISVARYQSSTGWGNAQQVLVPSRPWDLVQMGTCSSPIETPQGWLVLTHGVGPMRAYSIGALLLDLEDPTKVIGNLAEPLLVAAETEREGYVPNVVYSCGALLYGDSLLLPYGCSDATVRFAFIDTSALLSELTSGR